MPNPTDPSRPSLAAHRSGRRTPPRLARAGVLALCLAVVPCGAATEPSEAGPGDTAASPQEAASAASSDPGDWELVLPREVGMDEELVADLLQRIRRQRGVEEILVIRDDQAVIEAKFRGGRAGGPHNVKSASKSILSAIVGIALERGLFESLDQRLADIIPEAFEGIEDAPNELTLRHLLTMTTGLASTSGDAYGAWVESDDWVRAALAMPREAAPGKQFIYSTGNTHLLAAALDAAAREKTGEGLRAFAEEHLFEPLGLRVTGWETDPQGIPLGGNELSTRARDLARLGKLYLDGGRWNGKQLVPAAWIEESTRRHSQGWPHRYGAYGYLWWLPPTDRDAFMAVGYGGQFLYVDPTTDTIIVLFGTPSGKPETWDREVLALFQEITDLG